eukprot:6487365-Amphidinium_carterae.1
MIFSFGVAVQLAPPYTVVHVDLARLYSGMLSAGTLPIWPVVLALDGVLSCVVALVVLTLLFSTTCTTSTYIRPAKIHFGLSTRRIHAWHEISVGRVSVVVFPTTGYSHLHLLPPN